MIHSRDFTRTVAAAFGVGVLLAAAAPSLAAQTVAQMAAPVGPTASSYQGSVPKGEVSAATVDLSLDDAMHRGLETNLGMILSGTQTASARGELLSQLQSLLPTVQFNASENLTQQDLPAEGLRWSGLPTVLGPFGYTDIRAALSWSLADVSSLDTYLAAKHDFRAAKLSAEDARQMVILTVGNAYLLVLADQARVASVEAQVATAKVSLDQAVAKHQAGTAPLLDELRARVDYQTLEQRRIASQDALEKDKLALKRAVGIPVGQSIRLTDKAPYAAFDGMDVKALIRQAEANRKDLAVLVEQAQAAKEQRKAVTAERLPVLSANVDYGDIGATLGHSHGTVDATGKVSMPVFREFGIRGEAEQAQAKLDVAQAKVSDKKAQIEADVRDALLDIAAAQTQVEVARSSVGLANEALKEAQERYANGVSDNLAVSQAQQSVAQADDQLVASLYRDNVAKLSLARALDAADDYNKYLGFTH